MTLPDKGVQNRRTWSRMPASSFQNVKATLNSGIEVELVNVSRGGAQIRTAKRMLPGLGVTLHLVTADGRLTMRGKAIRSSMVQLSNGVLGYEVGVAFDNELGTPGRVPAQDRAGLARADAATSRSVVQPPAVPAASVPSATAGAEPEPRSAGPVPARESAPAATAIAPPRRRGQTGARTALAQFEILDPNPRNNVDINADLSNESLDGLIELLKRAP